MFMSCLLGQPIKGKKEDIEEISWPNGTSSQEYPPKEFIEKTDV